MKELINNKQFEFINGGVSMNDEATCYYEDMIDNLTYGHRFIKNYFGIENIPTVGWQIDPFGHTIT